MRLMRFWLWLLSIVAWIVPVSACSGPAPTAIIEQPPAHTPLPALSESSSTATATAIPTATPPPTLTPTPTPHPLLGYTIEGLRQRAYPGGAIEVLNVMTATASYTRYYIAYPSDDLTITGLMHVPHGDGPFPVVILNHGYIPPSRYVTGSDTWRAADYLANNGYLTLSPDFRGWGGSDEGDNFFRTGLVIDVLNLISSLPSLPQADPNRVGMWGHSMGGGVTTKAIAIDPRIKAAVLYGPVSADDTEVLARWGGGRGAFDQEGDSLIDRSYRLAARDPDFLQLTSPIHYFDTVTAHVQIHQGAADTTTPPRWAEAIRDGLQAAGRNVEYFSYPGQGHAFEGDSWWLFLQRIVEFFDANL